MSKTYDEENSKNSAESSREKETFFDDENFDKESFDNRPGIPKRKTNFFVELFTKIENFSKGDFKEKVEVKKSEKKVIKEKKKELKKSETTISDIQDQRKNHIKFLMKKVLLIGFIVILITGAVILSLQDNEQITRPNINMKKVLNDTTSFGGIDQKDYFLEQNVLEDKINIVERNAEKGRKELEKKILEQTDIVTTHLDKKLDELSGKQSEQLRDTKDDILSIVEMKIVEIALTNKETLKKVGTLSDKVDNYKDAPRMKLNNGKIIFPTSSNFTSKTAKIINPIKPLSDDTLSTDLADIKIEYETVEVDMSSLSIPELTFDTGLEDINQTVIKNIEFDLTTTLVRITLINGIKAPTLDIGVKNPTPVLMSVDGIAYAANDQTSGILKGCLLRGVAIGNINTSRAEIFGTHLSCILEGDSGDLYKVEHTFPNNSVWIKGEDGADGVSGLIVDSSGKILSKSAAIGFMQGLTNYFSAQNLVTGGLTTTNQSTVTQLGTSMKSGVGSGMSTGFDLIIAKYEEILGGYYPFIDVKGGRKNLTAIFGGGVKIVATPYIEAHLENY